MERLRRWTDWYEFARETLDYEEIEATLYARARYAEELNRQKLASGAAAAGTSKGGSGTPAARSPDPH